MSGDSKDKPERPDRPGHPRGDGFGARPPRPLGAGPRRARSQGRSGRATAQQVQGGAEAVGLDPRRADRRRPLRARASPLRQRDRAGLRGGDGDLEGRRSGGGPRCAALCTRRPATTTSGFMSASGRIALEEFRDPTPGSRPFRLRGRARPHGHCPPEFAGILPADRPNNRPFYEAIDGLIRCLEALGQHDEAAELTRLRDRLSRRPPRSRRDGLAKGPIGGVEKARRRGPSFFDFRNFSDLQGSADRDRTTAERDLRARRNGPALTSAEPCADGRKPNVDEQWFREREWSVSSSESIRVGGGLPDRGRGGSRRGSHDRPFDRRRRGSPRAGEVKPVPGGPGTPARRLSRDRDR